MVMTLCGVYIITRFDDLDFVSKSQVCEKYKLQIACFEFLLFVVKTCMAATYIKKILHNMICVTVVCIEGR